MKKFGKKLVLFAIAGVLSLGVFVSPVHPIKGDVAAHTSVFIILPPIDEINH